MLKFFTAAVCLFAYNIASTLDEHPTLAIGSKAPGFSLQGVDGKMYSLSSFEDAKILVIVFTCNHCPTAQAYENRIIQITADYKDKGVAVVAINPNDPQSIRPDELNFSDLSDSYEEMKLRAKEHHFNFPYLYDGETQTIDFGNSHISDGGRESHRCRCHVEKTPNQMRVTSHHPHSR